MLPNFSKFSPAVRKACHVMQKTFMEYSENWKIQITEIIVWMNRTFIIENETNSIFENFLTNFDYWFYRNLCPGFVKL